jgi:hypothetical protein
MRPWIAGCVVLLLPLCGRGASDPAPLTRHNWGDVHSRISTVRPPISAVQSLSTQGTPPTTTSPFESGIEATPRNDIDRIVFGRLTSLGIEPAHLSSDAVFIRRVYVDLLGSVPLSDDVAAFLADRDPDKRRRLIDALLQRDEFADYWAMKWSDVLRVKSEFPINLWPNAVQAYHHWIRSSIRDNVPYDRFASELLTASGSNFSAPPVNFFRAVQDRSPEAIAGAVALTFIGVRVDNWSADRQGDLAAFFSRIGYKSTDEWKEEIVFFDPDKGVAPTGDTTLVFPDGSSVRLPRDADPREAFARWLVAPDNTWFARAFVNRIWFWLCGRGIVEEPDDFRPDNPPANPELLDFLAHELVSSGYDVKHVDRVILNSSTYQLSPIPRTSRPEAEANCAYALLRPLDAEVLIDAVDRIAGSTEQYSSPIPEPYTFVPPGQRTVMLADGSITSSFLVTFGRPPRDTGRALERLTRPSASQRLYLLNSSDIQRKLQQSAPLQRLIQGSRNWRQLATNLYLTVLSRPPTEEEVSIATSFGESSANRRNGGLDLAWALVNSAEFRYRH